MNSILEFFRRLRFRLGVRRFEHDLEEEMRLHVQLRAESMQPEREP